MCTHALMSPWTKVSLDIKCPWTILDKSLLGQMSPWTKISLDKSLLGQLSQHLASLRHTTHICEQRIDLCLLPDLAQFGKVFAKSRQKMSETKPGSSKSSILSYASCTPNA